MKLEIKELKLENFKGLKDFSLSPSPHVTSVYGTNGVGKSTLCDAWSWLITGNDAKNRSDYEIKTKNKDGHIEHRLNHSVSAVVDVDGILSDLSRTYKEQWVKPTGEKEHVLKGHTTEYVWDTIPLSKKSDYEARVNQLFGGHERFKLLSNPRYFLNIDWGKRRALLMELAGVTDESVMKHLADRCDDFKNLLMELKNNSLEDFRKKINADKKELKSKINEIPVKIREATLAIPVEPDYDSIENDIKSKETEYANIESEISDINKAFESKSKSIREQQNVILKKESRLLQIENEAKVDAEKKNADEGKKIKELKNRIAAVDTSVRSLNSDQALIISKIHRKESEIESMNDSLEGLRNRYTELNEQVFDETKAICPTCSQGLLGEQVMDLIKKFNSDKEENIQKNIADGKMAKAQISILSDQLKELISEKNAISEKIQSTQEEKCRLNEEVKIELNRKKEHYSHVDLLSGNLEYDGLKQEIEVLKSQVNEVNSPDVSELNAKKAEIRKSIEYLKDQLSVKKIADKQRNRIKELEIELKTLSQELATLERKEFVSNQFNRAKIEAIENGINGMFETIRWRMFRPLINGGEEECCEAILQCGNIYEAANNAGQINAGIECINTLSKFYDMYLPIFIDNCEAVVTLISSKSQIIKFIVDGKYNQLKVV